MALSLEQAPQKKKKEDLTQALSSGCLPCNNNNSSLPRGKAPGFDGLPYEFYQRFWEQLGPELTAVLQAAFQPDGPGQLPPDMTEGRITLLYKGKGLDRALPASYRPITLLNTDYKLAARVLADRLGPLLNHVVDSTQTGFLPQRWIGDNILAHLEIIAWYQRTQQPGVLLFLDFEKAFDRPWLQRCMAATGFGAGAQRWVSLMHASTSAKVAFNGWHTQRFPVQPGVFQGSPLSPLLFVLAVQPMSAHARQLATQQGLHGLRLPDGQASPFLHLHADDTTVHASTPADAQAVLDGSIALHVDATGARLQRSKSIGMGIGSLQHLVGPDQATGITFSAAGTSVRHLGIPLSTDAGRAAETLYADILQRLHTRIARWSGFRLSLLGRAHVAKQVLVSMFTYHGTFIPVPEQLLRQLCTAVYTFVAANRPVVAGAAHLHPSRDVSSRAVDQDKDYKVMELLRPAVLGCCDSLGVHWSGAWSHSVRPGSRPEASHGWRAHAYRRGDGTGWGQPGLAGKTKCVVPSVGKSDRAAREDVVLAQAALGHG
ncbi:g2089 [Coccomyxa viridis]|uniref:G2089 protein n=1 Tax=Coccomyxa viridis TaxID=1274662 RepID=A0ABP1FPY7_9CHLO